MVDVRGPSRSDLGLPSVWHVRIHRTSKPKTRSDEDIGSVDRRCQDAPLDHCCAPGIVSSAVPKELTDPLHQACRQPQITTPHTATHAAPHRTLNRRSAQGYRTWPRCEADAHGWGAQEPLGRPGRRRTDAGVQFVVNSYRSAARRVDSSLVTWPPPSRVAMASRVSVWSSRHRWP